MNKDKGTVADHFPGLTPDEIEQYLTAKDLLAEEVKAQAAEARFWHGDTGGVAQDYSKLTEEYKRRALPSAQTCELLVLKKLLG